MTIAKTGVGSTILAGKQPQQLDVPTGPQQAAEKRADEVAKLFLGRIGGRRDRSRKALAGLADRPIEHRGVELALSRK